MSLADTCMNEATTVASTKELKNLQKYVGRVVCEPWAVKENCQFSKLSIKNKDLNGQNVLD